MDTQNTPIHIRLWNKDFWLLAIANTFFSMAVSAQFVIFSEMLSGAGVPWRAVGYVLGSFAIGLPLMGPFCSFLVQRYRRNHVCLLAMTLTMACILVPILFAGRGTSFTTQLLCGVRWGTGVLFGLAQMILASTLVIDTCEAHQRTEANYAEAWFGHFALALGPLAAIVVIRFYGCATAMWVSATSVLVAVVMISMVQFPFRTPEDNVHVFSLDRFILPGAWLLFINLVLITAVFGMLLSMHLDSPMFFASLMGGFLLALLSEKYVFVNAELKSETVVGLILVVFAILLLMSGLQTHPFTVPILVGLGMGLIGSRFLLFFIKLSQHSKRGTSQSSFFLAWEMGLAVGMGCGLLLTDSDATHRCLRSGHQWMLAVALTLTVVALLLYVVFTHRWYLNHKNR